MELSGVNSAFTAEPKVVDAGFDNSKMEQDEFLKVLLADIQWQNPLEAKDISEFINNSVKLRQMEVLNNFESSVKALQGSSASETLLQASSLIGKTITYEGNDTYVHNGKGKAEFRLDGNAEHVTVSLFDSSGALVESNDFSNLSGGKSYPFEIDNPELADGYYTVVVDAQYGGEQVGTSLYSQAVVEGVTKKEGALSAYFGDDEVNIDTITQIGA
jgi:flagellar basal-body rod modification protein FlgD